MTIPEPDTLWRHIRGDICRVVLVANLGANTPSYPIMVVYQDKDKVLWARPLALWDGQYQRVDDAEQSD